MEILLHAASCDFVITLVMSDQISLHSVPLLVLQWSLVYECKAERNTKKTSVEMKRNGKMILGKDCDFEV